MAHDKRSQPEANRSEYFVRYVEAFSGRMRLWLEQGAIPAYSNLVPIFNEDGSVGVSEVQDKECRDRNKSIMVRSKARNTPDHPVNHGPTEHWLTATTTATLSRNYAEADKFSRDSLGKKPHRTANRESSTH